jgi:hypothetical protein
MTYQVSRQGQALDPMSIDEIVRMVRSKELDLFDYIFDESKDDWVLLMEFPPLAGKLKSSKPPRPQRTEVDDVTVTQVDVPAEAAESQASPTGETEWFILKGENQFGPFSYVDVIKMLQQKIVFPFDMIWNANLDSWKRLAEMSEFQQDSIRKLFAQSGKKNDVFVTRQYPRKPFTGRVVVHDNLTIWKGESFEISKGGVGIQMSNSLVAPGQQVIVHFRKTDDWPTFNAVCEVVSKKFVSDDSPVQYGLRFMSISQETQEEFYKKVK